MEIEFLELKSQRLTKMLRFDRESACLNADFVSFVYEFRMKLINIALSSYKVAVTRKRNVIVK